MQAANTTEVLVDYFLEGKLFDKEDEFSFEGEIEDAHDADTEDNYMERTQFLKKIGRDVRNAGDEFLTKCSSKTSLIDQVKNVFKKKLSPDELFEQYKTIMDIAVKDVGVDDHGKILGAVLLTVEGLQSLGTGVKDAVMRYIREKNLNDELEKIKLKNEGSHPGLD